MKKVFALKAPFLPAGDQPKAIESLIDRRPGVSTLMGVTGSGKTFTLANVIAAQSKPVLILAPNKTLAAQLYEEFSLFFPENKVSYFVSYYDYYQPESYVPATDMYIAKETRVNSELDRLRLDATASIVHRPDTIVIASVSCIYSIGNPDDWRSLAFNVHVGQKLSRKALIDRLVSLQYMRNDFEHAAGTFAVIGNTIEIYLAYTKDVLRIEHFGSEIDRLEWIHRQNHTSLMTVESTVIFPAKHFVTTEEKKKVAVERIQSELNAWLPQVKSPLYKERIKTRIAHDIEMLQERGYCSGIENYSIHFDGRASGAAPFCLLDYFADDFLLIIDESHLAIPQLSGMYKGDRSRKKTLIDFGFRLPSALDNRPLMFEEIERYFSDAIFVSATPGQYELEKSDAVIEQIIRPTGLVDPRVEMHPREGQMEDLIRHISETREKGFRSLVTVLTKKMAEELAYYLEERQIKVCYLHSSIKTPERTELLHKLRTGVFDCLVGVNLLREGLDLPEVAFVAIMDADVESFLRDKRSLIQTIGRAARNTESLVVLYMDTMTRSVKAALDETNRRRKLQAAHNKAHNITPKTVRRDVVGSILKLQKAVQAATKRTKKKRAVISSHEMQRHAQELERQMQEAAERLDFETAIRLRSEWRELQDDLASKQSKK